MTTPPFPPGPPGGSPPPDDGGFGSPYGGHEPTSGAPPGSYASGGYGPPQGGGNWSSGPGGAGDWPPGQGGGWPPPPGEPPGGPGPRRNRIVLVVLAVLVALVAATVVVVLLVNGGSDGPGDKSPGASSSSSESSSDIPSGVPSELPSGIPTEIPTALPSEVPSWLPSGIPTEIPSDLQSLFATPANDEVPYYLLKKGDCFDTNADRLGQAARRSCAAPHEAEVVAITELRGTYATDSALRRAAAALCETPLERGAADRPAGTVRGTLVQYPDQNTYKVGIDDVACSLAVDTGKGADKPAAH